MASDMVVKRPCICWRRFWTNIVRSCVLSGARAAASPSDSAVLIAATGEERERRGRLLLLADARAEESVEATLRRLMLGGPLNEPGDDFAALAEDVGLAPKPPPPEPEPEPEPDPEPIAFEYRALAPPVVEHFGGRVGALFFSSDATMRAAAFAMGTASLRGTLPRGPIMSARAG